MSDGTTGIDEAVLLRALFAASPDALMLVDDTGRIRLANPTVSQLLGYTNEELIGAPVEMLVPDSIRPRHAAYRQAYEHAPARGRWAVRPPSWSRGVATGRR